MRAWKGGSCSSIYFCRKHSACTDPLKTTTHAAVYGMDEEPMQDVRREA